MGKKRILLMDTLSTIHVGNGALLDNTIKLCKLAWGDCEFDIITMDKETNALKFNKRNLYGPMFGTFWFGLGKSGKIFWAFKNFLFILAHVINEKTLKIDSKKLTFKKEQRKAIEAIEKNEICISCGGEIIGDTFYQALPFWLFTYWLAIQKGKKFILFPQSIGPLKKWWTRWLVSNALKNAHLYVGRDQVSYETLLSLGFAPDKVMFVPDVAIQQEIGKADIHKYFNDNCKKVIGITISNPPFSELGKKVDFVQEISSQIEKLNPQKYNILVMPSNYKLHGVSDDYSLCLKLKERLLDKFEVAILENRSHFPDEYTTLLSQLEFFISTRMHVAILATTVFIPTIAIKSQHKIMGYMRNIEMEHFCIEYENLNKIFELIQKIENSRDKIVEHLKSAIAKLKKEHEKFESKLREIA